MYEGDKSGTVHLVKWLLTSADIWYMIYKCADYVSKAQGPTQHSLQVLNTIFTVDDEADLAAISNGQQNLNQQRLDSSRTRRTRRHCKLKHFFT